MYNSLHVHTSAIIYKCSFTRLAADAFGPHVSSATITFLAHKLEVTIEPHDSPSALCGREGWQWTRASLLSLNVTWTTFSVLEFEARDVDNLVVVQTFFHLLDAARTAWKKWAISFFLQSHICFLSSNYQKTVFFQKSFKFFEIEFSIMKDNSPQRILFLVTKIRHPILPSLLR